MMPQTEVRQALIRLARPAGARKIAGPAVLKPATRSQAQERAQWKAIRRQRAEWCPPGPPDLRRWSRGNTKSEFRATPARQTLGCRDAFAGPGWPRIMKTQTG